MSVLKTPGSVINQTAYAAACAAKPVSYTLLPTNNPNKTSEIYTVAELGQSAYFMPKNQHVSESAANSLVGRLVNCNAIQTAYNGFGIDGPYDTCVGCMGPVGPNQDKNPCKASGGSSLVGILALPHNSSLAIFRNGNGSAIDPQFEACAKNALIAEVASRANETYWLDSAAAPAKVPSKLGLAVAVLVAVNVLLQHAL